MKNLELGAFHNEYMDRYFESLKAKIYEKGYHNLTRADFKKVLQEEVLSIVSGATPARGITVGYAESLYDDIVRFGGPGETIDRLKGDLEKLPGSQPFITLLCQVLLEARAVCTQDEKEAFIANYIKVGEETLEGVELEILKAGLDVFDHSFTYWNRKLGKIRDLIDPDHQGDLRVGPGGIGSSDMGGAVSGGVTGAIIGGSVTLGGAAVPGWLAGAAVGGLSSSIGEAVSQFWDWLWD